MVYPANVLGIQGVRGSSPHISTQVPGLLDRRPRCYYPFGTKARGNPAMWARTSPATRRSMPLCVILGDRTVCGETGHQVLATVVLESFLDMMGPPVGRSSAAALCEPCKSPPPALEPSVELQRGARMAAFPLSNAI